MDTKEEILQEFFKVLEQKGKLPNTTIQYLKELWQAGNLASQLEIRTAIERGISYDSKNQIN